MPTTPTALGPQTVITTGTAGDQFIPVVTALASGGYVSAIYNAGAVTVQFLSNTGTRVGAEITVSATGAPDDIQQLSNGNILVCWSDGGTTFMRQMDTSGAWLGAAVTQPSSSNFGVDALTGGGWVTTQTWNAGSSLTKVYDASGALQSTINVPGPMAVTAVLSTGNLMVAYSSGSTIVGQVYTSAGATVGSTFAVSPGGAFGQHPDITVLAGGRVAVGWTQQTNASNDISFRIFEADGTPVTGEVVVTNLAGRQERVAVTALNDGGLIITWCDLSNGDGSGEGVMAQRFDAAGAAVGSIFVVNSDVGGHQWQTNGYGGPVAQLQNGDVAWVFATPGDSNDAVTRVFDVDGNPAGALPGGPGPDTLTGDGGDNTVTFSAANLGSGDSFDGGAGFDSVGLNGGGTFDFRGVTLTNVEEITTDGTSVTLQMADESLIGLLAGLDGADDRIEFDSFTGGADFIDTLFDLADVGVEEVAYSSRGNTVEVTWTDGGTLADQTDDRLVFVYTDDPTDQVQKTYSTQTKTFDRNGFIRSVETISDEGRTSLQTYNATGQLTQVSTFDGPGNTENYVSVVTDYVGGVISQSVVTLDNGVTNTTSYVGGIKIQLLQEDGPGDTFAWQSLTTTYFSDGSLASRSQINDAGDAITSIYTDYNLGVVMSKAQAYANGDTRIDSFVLGVLDLTVVAKADGSRTVTGTAGSQTLFDGTGSDSLKGGAGADVFRFGGGANGNDRVLDFQDGVDRLKIDGFTAFNDLQTAATFSHSKNGLVIDFHDNSLGTITVTGLTLATFSAADLIFSG